MPNVMPCVAFITTADYGTHIHRHTHTRIQRHTHKPRTHSQTPRAGVISITPFRVQRADPCFGSRDATTSRVSRRESAPVCACVCRHLPHAASPFSSCYHMPRDRWPSANILWLVVEHWVAYVDGGPVGCEPALTSSSLPSRARSDDANARRASTRSQRSSPLQYLHQGIIAYRVRSEY